MASTGSDSRPPENSSARHATERPIGRTPPLTQRPRPGRTPAHPLSRPPALEPPPCSWNRVSNSSSSKNSSATPTSASPRPSTPTSGFASGAKPSTPLATHSGPSRSLTTRLVQNPSTDVAVSVAVKTTRRPAEEIFGRASDQTHPPPVESCKWRHCEQGWGFHDTSCASSDRPPGARIAHDIEQPGYRETVQLAPAQSGSPAWPALIHRERNSTSSGGSESRAAILATHRTMGSARCRSEIPRIAIRPSPSQVIPASAEFPSTESITNPGRPRGPPRIPLPAPSPMTSHSLPSRTRAHRSTGHSSPLAKFIESRNSRSLPITPISFAILNHAAFAASIRPTWPKSKNSSKAPSRSLHAPIIHSGSGGSVTAGA